MTGEQKAVAFFTSIVIFGLGWCGALVATTRPDPVPQQWECDSDGYIVEPPGASPEETTDIIHRNVVLRGKRIRAMQGHPVNPLQLAKAEGCR